MPQDLRLDLSDFGDMANLRELAVPECELCELPQCFSGPVSLMHLNLAFNNFAGFSLVVFQLPALEHLDMSNKPIYALDELPEKC